MLSTGKGPHEQNPPLSVRLGSSLESSLISSFFLIPTSFHSVIPPAGFLDPFPQSAVLVEGHLLILHLNCFITLNLLQVMPPLAASRIFLEHKTDFITFMLRNLHDTSLFSGWSPDFSAKHSVFSTPSFTSCHSPPASPHPHVPGHSGLPAWSSEQDSSSEMVRNQGSVVRQIRW